MARLGPPGEDSQGVEKRYYLVVLAQGTTEYEPRDAIQSISLAVYEALTGTEVDPKWSRGEHSSLLEEENIDQEGAAESYLP